MKSILFLFLLLCSFSISAQTADYWYNPTQEFEGKGVSALLVDSVSATFAYTIRTVSSFKPEEPGWIYVGKFDTCYEIQTGGLYKSRWLNNTKRLQGINPTMAH